jgi:Domain of unknown function (DUF4190)
MSDTSQGHGWWLASDGKWYPPEAWTGPPPQMGQVPPQPGQLPYQPGQLPYQPGQPPYPSGQVPYQPGQSPYAFSGYPPQGAPWPRPRPTNGLAVASLVSSCVGIVPFLFGVPCILGIIFGFVSRGRIKRSNGTLGGEGLALAGIIVGFGLIGIFIIFVVLLAIFGHTQNCNANSVQFDCRGN